MSAISWSLLLFLPLLAFFSYSLSSAANGGRVSSKLNFLVAGRSIGTIPAAFSVAAAWIWAPALFVSAQKAFIDGWVGLFWFTVPNVVCLILFSFFATKIRTLKPEGFTLSELMRDVYSDRVQSLYWVSLIGLTMCAFAVQLLAGGTLLSTLTGLNYPLCAAILALMPLAYSLAFGLRSSIFTDFVKIIIIFLGFALIVPILFSTVGLDAVISGMSGVKHDVVDLFDARGMGVFLAFGLPVTIGLLSGPFGDQAFWQRAFAIGEPSKVRSAFISAAFIFGIVPALMGIIGFAAAGTGFIPKNPEMVNIEFIGAVLPGWVLVVFVMMAFAGIVSILDSKLCAVSSIVGHDIYQRFKGKTATEEGELYLSRVSMLGLTVAAFAISQIPDLKLVHLFLFYGTLRASTMLPTIYTLMTGGKTSEGSIFWGVVTALSIGLPAFAYGTLTKNTSLALAASIFTVLLPGIVIALSRVTAALRRENV